jgi:hypothetical protein
MKYLVLFNLRTAQDKINVFKSNKNIINIDKMQNITVVTVFFI